MNNQWSGFFSSHHNTGLYFLTALNRVEAKIIKEAEECNLKPVIINMQRVTRKQTFLKKMAEALKFPGYFGHNWDALFECLTDLAWLKTTGQVILIYNLHSMADESPGDFRIIRRVFETAAAYWRAREACFFVFINEKPSATDKAGNAGSTL